MRSNRIRVFLAGAAVVALAVCAEVGFSLDKDSGANDPVNGAVARGLRWLTSTQGKDGGWGQDGGETSYVRQGERLESNGNDVANTAVVAEALLHTGTTPLRGPYREALNRAVEFVLKHVEESPAGGLAVTDLRGTQIQRKLGPYIDTFLASKLLAELDGTMATAAANTRVRAGLQKCVAKIEKNQLKDGSWNIAGGWAPILGTSMASQSLAMAQAKGAANPQAALDKVQEYSKLALAAPASGRGSYGGYGSGSGGGVGPGMAGGVAGGTPGGVLGGIIGGVPSAAPPPPVKATDVTASRPIEATPVTIYGSASAGVPLYQSAQALEQLSRTEKDRKENAVQITAINGQLANAQFVTGFGSIGGEEFFSWLNVSESLRRTGGPAWEKWNGEMKARLIKLQNEDGTWAGHHCITGRVAVTSAAILLLTADREPPAAAPKILQTSTQGR